MSFWDNVKKFTQPYSDEEYDDYDDEEYLDDYEEPVEQPVRRERRRPSVCALTKDVPLDASLSRLGVIISLLPRAWIVSKR